MAAFNGDGFGPLFRQMCEDLRPIRDAILLVGTCYSLKVTAEFAWELFQGSRKNMVPNMAWFQKDLVGSYGEWAVVTLTSGPSECLGLAFARELQRRNVKVVLIFFGHPELKAQDEKRVQLKLGDLPGVELSVVSPKFSSQEMSAILSEKDIGILINNAESDTGIEYFSQVDDASLLYCMDVGVSCAVRLCRFVLPQMESKAKGAVINMASGWTRQPVPLQTTWAASKAFLRQFTESLGHEYWRKGITIQTWEPLNICDDADADADTGADASAAENRKDSDSATPTSFQKLKSYWPHRLLRPFSPTPYVYATCALHSLGRGGSQGSNTGYWPHGALMWMLDFFPRWLRVYYSLAANLYRRHRSSIGMGQ